NLLETPGSFDLLHFAGHGTANQADISDARILLEGRIEGSNYVLDSFRATLVSQYANFVASDQRRPMVVLNACQVARQGYRLSSIGGFAQAFLSANAGA